MEKIEILQVISSNGFFGAERVTLNLCRFLRETFEFSVTIGIVQNSRQIEPNTFDSFRKYGFHPFSIPGWGRINLQGVNSLREHLAKRKIRIVHSHNYKSNMYSLVASSFLSNVKLVSTCHNWIDSDWKVKGYGHIDRYILRHFDATVAVSETVQERLTQSGFDKKKVQTIENVLLPEDCETKETNGEGKELKNGMTLGFIGRISKEKGLDLLLLALGKLQGKYPELRLLVAGDGPQRSEFEGLSKLLCRPGTVNWLGFQDDVPAIMKQIDVFVLPSLIEASPMVLLEAMAGGKAIVATNVGGIPNLIRNGENGLLVESGDPIGLENAIGDLSGNKELQGFFGNRSREDYFRYASCVNTYNRYLELYQSLGNAG